MAAENPEGTSGEAGRKTCVSCATVSPPADGEFALIRDGWRLTLKEDAGRKRSEWWCPTCFARARASTQKRSP